MDKSTGTKNKKRNRHFLAFARAENKHNTGKPVLPTAVNQQLKFRKYLKDVATRLLGRNTKPKSKSRHQNERLSYFLQKNNRILGCDKLKA